jgi:hypothetical protein
VVGRTYERTSLMLTTNLQAAVEWRGG